jgi:hypothetical protein
MAKAPTKQSGSSRFRLVVLEAEVGDGNISELSQAIANALGRGTSVQKISSMVAGPNSPVSSSVKPEEDTFVELEDEPLEPTTRSSKRSRKISTPTVLELDFDSAVSLDDFAGKANPQNNHKRYLVIAAWLKDHRKLDSFGVDHIYTCFRKLKWPTNISDFSQPLRDLKAKQHLNSPGRGQYSINQLGLAEVQELINP